MAKMHGYEANLFVLREFVELTTERREKVEHMLILCDTITSYHEIGVVEEKDDLKTVMELCTFMTHVPGAPTLLDYRENPAKTLETFKSLVNKMDKMYEQLQSFYQLLVDHIQQQIEELAKPVEHTKPSQRSET